MKLSCKHYLRFIRGLVDTNALPLNVSRELLQETAVTGKWTCGVTSAGQKTKVWLTFWEA